MANNPNGDRQGLGVLIGALALVVCCALPLLAVLVGGALATAGGLVARFWPLILVGVAVAVWAAIKLPRALRATREGRPGQRQPRRRRT